MSWGNNIYSSPEKFGIEMLGEIEMSEPCYSFDTFAVFKRQGRRGPEYAWAHDAGCSCPSPFEDYDNPDELEWGDPKSIMDGFYRVLKDGYFSEADIEKSMMQFVNLFGRMVNDG